MEIIVEFGKILLPAGLVLYAMYLTMKSIMAKEALKASMDYKIANSNATLPNRLQAFERMSLFLERLSPGNLVLRLNNSNMTAKEFMSVAYNRLGDSLTIDEMVAKSKTVAALLKD